MTALLKLTVYVILTSYIFGAVGFFVFGFSNILCWIIGFSILFLALLTYIYLHGLNTDNHWQMIPFLTVELIVRLIVGAVVILSWITYLLNEFDQIHVESPVDFLETDQFLLFTSIFVTLFFVLLIRIYFPLYEEYRSIKKLNDRRRMERDNGYEENYARLHFSARPTDL